MLIKGADLLVQGASSLAKRMHVSDMVVGLTVVSFGTSAPELAVNLLASLQGNNDLALGNIIGSNIANTLLVLGIATLLGRLRIRPKTFWQEMPLNFFIVVVLGIMLNDQFTDPQPHCSQAASLAWGAMAYCNFLGRGDAAILIIGFVLFMLYVYHQSRSHPEEAVFADSVDTTPMPLWKALFFVVLGLVGLAVGGHWIVEGAVFLGQFIGLSEAVVGVVIIGVGTSLPEVAASAMAAYRGKADIAIGNVIGSNVFNVLYVLGISAFVKPIPYDTVLNIDISVMIAVAFLFWVIMFIPKRYELGLAKGLFFLVLYVAYVLYLLLPL